MITTQPLPQPVPSDLPRADVPVIVPAAESTSGRMVRNALALGLSRPFTWLSATGMTILIPRYLGDSNVGKMNAAFAYADWCGLLVSLGIATYLTKEVARRGTTVGALVLNALVLRMALAVLVGLGIAALATALVDDTLTRHLVYLLSIHMMLTVIIGVLTGALQGMQHLRIVALVDGVSKMLLFGLVAVFLLQGFGLRPVAVAFVLSDLVELVWLFVIVRGRGAIGGAIDVGSWKSLLTGGAPFAVWEASLLAYARFDVILLGFFATNAVLGWYYAAYRIISLPLFLPVILMTVTLPALAANAKDPATFNSIARRGVLAAALASVPMAIGLMLLSDEIIHLFGWREEYANASWPIIVLAAGLPLVAINMIVAPALAALDKQRSWAFLGVGAAVLNISVNLAVIPLAQAWWDNGAIGAGAVTTMTEVYLLVGGLILLPRTVLDRATFLAVAKIVIAGGVMAAVLWLAISQSIFLLVPLGALVYGVAVLALRVISPDDLRTIAGHALSRRSRGSDAPTDLIVPAER